MARLNYTPARSALVLKNLYEDYLLDKNTILIAETFDRVEVTETRRLGNHRQHKCRTFNGKVFYCGDTSIQLDCENHHES